MEFVECMPDSADASRPAPDAAFVGALAVARYEVLAVIRDRQRERLMFDDDVALMMADASVSADLSFFSPKDN
jgi:hypothetical protein